MMDLAHAFHCSWRSLSGIQALVLAGKLGNKPGCLKPLDNLKIAISGLEASKQEV